MDTALAISSGLPPIIDDSSWDVRPICELKDNFLGTPEGDAYIKDVDADRRSHDNISDPTVRNSQSMVDVHYVVARTMHWFSSKSLELVRLSELIRLKVTCGRCSRFMHRSVTSVHKANMT